MQKTFTIKGNVFLFADEDVRRAAAVIKVGSGDRVRFFTKVNGKFYSVRQLFVEMVKLKGTTMPDATTHEAIRVLRALGFEITEQSNQEQNIVELAPVSPKLFSIKCAYCKGTGKNPAPGNITNEDCRKCQGTGERNLTGVKENYKTDEICNGTGRDLHGSDPWEPCHICDGTGLVKNVD